MVPPEIIDLTEGAASPPPPSRFSDGPTILNFAVVDPVLSDFQNHVTTTSVWPPSMHIYDPSANPSYYHYQGSNNNSSSFFFQPYMHAHHHHQPDCLTADWTLRDHELFMMGLSNYGRGHWNKIARHYLHNKTPQQVQSYANRFFSHQPPSPPPSSSTHFYNFRIRNPSSSSTYPSSGDEPIKKTLMLFPEKKEHNEMFGTRETATTTTNTAANNYDQYGFLFGIIPTTTTIGASSSSFMSGSGNYYEEIDLELRLGSS
ncbi:hypothetical protein HN51_057212 [Arachis hypogaea]|uniref:Uncharacterized protein n=1 Tax=Arachis hypogaea TaxID=3818 RepID=A0A444WWD2_ARAHY|nr:uncharacterized protein LOC107619865 [Arachis ipaensis]XP_025682780.1 uncharacterized protein LOC112783914 [Arachis hypogaea]QHN80321.1 Transcription factor DIVARICATA [Arachis hypogaea]RYQ81734.1 hypothetical protein Ahy_B10g100349 [Arachis hypogaea]